MGGAQRGGRCGTLAVGITMRHPFRAVLRRINARRIAYKYRAYTMVPKRALIDNLLLAGRVSQLPGCVVECGVWRGGMTAGIAEILGPDRHYYLFDSFEGLPPAQEIDGAEAIRWQREGTSPHYHDNCAAEIAFARKAMAMSPATRVTFKQGWFQDTLAGLVPAERIAILRLDADWYESTIQCLEALYQYIAVGGLILIDDYYTWEGCAKAVHDFLSSHKLPDRIRHSASGVCYIFRSV